MPDPIAAAAATTPTTPTTTSKADSSLGGLGKDAFLKLLVAQLKYQNPLSPQDPSQMMGQTAQFTMVEKLEDLADQAALQVATQRGVLASSMLGRTVTATDGSGAALSGAVTAVDLTASEPTVTVDGKAVPVSSIKTVAATAAPTASPAS